MKKILMMLFLLAIAGVISGQVDFAQAQTQTAVPIVINEYELNPAGDDDGHEWVELYNRTTSNLNISGWTLRSTHGDIVTVTLPKDTIILAKGYLVVVEPNGKQWLDNDDESLVLRDAQGTEQDRTHADNSDTKKDTRNDARTWQRCPNGFDTNEPGNWNFAASSRGEDGKGAANNCQ